jgi:hypothetical protein
MRFLPFAGVLVAAALLALVAACSNNLSETIGCTQSPNAVSCSVTGAGNVTAPAGL